MVALSTAVDAVKYKAECRQIHKAFEHYSIGSNPEQKNLFSGTQAEFIHIIEKARSAINLFP
jgi:hypothetical protein